jgi:hypothetical protein
MPDERLIEWLFAAGGPILRYRTAVELMGVSGRECARLLDEALAAPQARRWFSNLSQARTIHGSRDTDAENALAKLLDFGFDRTIPAFEAGIAHLLACPLRMWDRFVLPPFLLRAGYLDHPLATAWLTARLDQLYRTASAGDFSFYLDPDQAVGVPAAWRGKPIYRDEFGHEAGYPLPTCYDFYALAYTSGNLALEGSTQKREAVLAFLSDPRFQSTLGGYGWDRPRHRCYAAGRVFLACVEPARLVLFLELGARCEASRRSDWFRRGLSQLEGCRTPSGSYRFPPAMMAERSANHLYGGSHMGLGENRRSPQALELESTFRMLTIQKAMGN